MDSGSYRGVLEFSQGPQDKNKNTTSHKTGCKTPQCRNDSPGFFFSFRTFLDAPARGWA